MYVRQARLDIPTIGLDEWAATISQSRANARDTGYDFSMFGRETLATLDGVEYPANLMYIDCGPYEMIVVVLAEPGQTSANPLCSEQYVVVAVGCILKELCEDHEERWVVQQRLLYDPLGFPQFVRWSEGPQAAIPPEIVAAYYMVRHGMFPQLAGVVDSVAT